MSKAIRIPGLVTPLVLLILGGWLERRGILPIDGPLGAGLGIVAIGCVAGVLLRRWWAIVYAPLVFGVPWVIYQTATGYTMEPGEATTMGSFLLALFWLVLFSVPYALGAFVGTALGRLVAEPDMSMRARLLRRQCVSRVCGLGYRSGTSYRSERVDVRIRMGAGSIRLLAAVVDHRTIVTEGLLAG